MDIVVGIIRLQNCRIFITQRGEHSHLSGFWEFPGGKMEGNETPEDALFRELYEEVGIRIHCPVFLKTVHHRYRDREITMRVYLVEDWDGDPCGKEGQNSRWVLQSMLNVDDFPGANRPIIEMLKKSDKTMKCNNQ